MTIPLSTLLGNNGSPANLGSVAVQPTSTTVSSATNQTVPASQIASGITPAREAELVVPVVSQSANILTKLATTTLSSLANRVLTDPTFVVPLASPLTHVTSLVPTYNLTLTAGQEVDPRVTQGFATTTAQFTPYETLTGISQQRPEVVMLTNFLPLFKYDVSTVAPNFISLVEAGGINTYMTDAGLFMDAQMQMRNMRSYNTQQLLTSVQSKYPNISQQMATRSANFAYALNELNTDASFLLNLVRIIETQKAQLDLRHDMYTVNPVAVTVQMAANFMQQQVQAAAFAPSLTPNVGSLPPPVAPASVTTRHKPQYDFVDTLVALGYTQSTVQSIYASTKVWMQTLLELSYALKYHTLQFLDIDPSYQRNDTNASTILDPNVTRFSLSTNLPTLPSLSSIVAGISSDQITTINSAITSAFQVIYQNVSFKDEEARIAALAHLLSAEYRFSEGLSNANAQRVLQDYYGFTVNTKTGNSSVFDYVIGKFGNNISDFPAQGTNALTSVAQQVPVKGTGVLTFESQYVEGDTGTLTPGGAYYIDNVLQTQTTATTFNTKNITALATVLNSAYNAFNTITDCFNLQAQPATVNNVLNSDASILTSTGDLLNAIKLQLVDANGNTSTLLQNDLLASVFAFARNNNDVKASLFLYVIGNVSRNYDLNVPFLTANAVGDNTPLVDTLITQINAAIQAAVPVTYPIVQRPGTPASAVPVTTTSALTPASISSALKAGTPLTLLIEQLMSQIVAQFTSNTTAIYNEYTRYNGFIDTVVMMTAFDLITSMVARYGNVSITGAQLGFTTFTTGVQTYTLSRTTIAHSNSINELTERAAGEDTRVQQMILVIINALTTLQGSLTGITNYLQSPVATSQLEQIAQYMANPQMMQMLFSEQQIMLFASTVQNMVSANTQGSNSQQPASNANGNNTNTVTVLDESDVPQVLQDAVYGLFSTPDYGAKQGINKRLLSVGIPQGFTQQLKQKVNIRNQQKVSFQNRRNDIVQVCVYKIDMVNSDIVYKPQRFLFEMSRFPVRTSYAQWLPLPQRPALQDIVNSIPTQCYSADPNTTTSTASTTGVEYASSVVAGADGLKTVQVAMTDASYSFLTANQKAEILQNHVTSQLFEAYIKLMTGMNVAEYVFDMVPTPAPIEQSFIKTLTEHQIANVANVVSSKSGATTTIQPTSGGVLFSTTAPTSTAPVQGSTAPTAIAQPQLSNPAGIGGAVSRSSQYRAIQAKSVPIKTLAQQAVVGNTDNNLNAISPRNIPVVLETLRSISAFSDTLTSVSDPTSVTQKLLTPKQFDRIFNVVIDPTAFEVDVNATTSTPYGTQALNLMIKDGELVSATENDSAIAQSSQVGVTVVTPGSRPVSTGQLAANVNAYTYRPRSKGAGDLITDKYFITIETLDENASS